MKILSWIVANGWLVWLCTWMAIYKVPVFSMAMWSLLIPMIILVCIATAKAEIDGVKRASGGLKRLVDDVFGEVKQ